MKLWAHCQRCLVCSKCLIQEDAYARGEIQFPQCGLDSIHEATTGWLCKGLDLREQSPHTSVNWDAEFRGCGCPFALVSRWAGDPYSTLARRSTLSPHSGCPYCWVFTAAYRRRAQHRPRESWTPGPATCTDQVAG